VLGVGLVSEPWNLEAEGSTPRCCDLQNELADIPEPISATVVSALSKCGLWVIQRDEASDAALGRASRLLRGVPSLDTVLRRVTKGVVRLRSDDDAVDIGHSEPRWPGIVFVSFPPPSEVGDVRLIEGLIHEAMHINLSNNGIDSLVTEQEPLVYSPWRAALRPASGVLHAAYVFTCVLRFFELLDQTRSLTPAQSKHVTRRQTEILREFDLLPRNELAVAVGELGRRVCCMIFRYIEPLLSLQPSTFGSHLGVVDSKALGKG
jgi:HEXXH motif-containing protein